MTVRALIIAIEDYPNVAAGGLATKLDGTIQAGLAFRDWLTEKWKRENVNPADQHLILCTEPRQQNGLGATAADIKQALLELEEKGAAQTDELYVYLSGHGFTLVGAAGDKTSVLIGSDFKSPKLSGDACLSVGYLMRWLSAHLGPGRQSYFVNLCRNTLDVTTIAAGGPFLPFSPTINGEGSTFVIYAAAAGDVTQVNSKFNQYLIDGLKGRGRAKVWDENGIDMMRVRYSSLKQHLAQRLGRPVEGSAQGLDTDMDYDMFAPPPRNECTILIVGEDNVEGAIEFMSNRDDQPTIKPVVGKKTVLPLMPDLYRFSIKTKSGSVEPAVSAVIDLYDEATVTFTVKPNKITSMGGLEGFAIDGDETDDQESDGLEADERTPSSTSLREYLKAPQKVVLRLVIPAGCELDLTNGSPPRKTTTYTVSGAVEIKADSYSAVLRQGDVEINRQDLDLKVGERREIALGRWQNSSTHADIAKALQSDSDEVWFSETLGGPVVDIGLDLWLALAGAGRILLGGDYGGYEKLARLPLVDFRNLRPDVSPIYVLAGSLAELPPIELAVSKGAFVKWQTASPPREIRGVREAYFDVPSGSHLLSFRVGDRPAYTVATCASPNRATLVTIVLDAQGELVVSQFMLPIGTLASRLAEYPLIMNRWQTNAPLSDVQFLVRAMRKFRDRRRIFNHEAQTTFRELLYANWIDPITSALFSYEMLRRGEKEVLAEVIANMKQYFETLPDSTALELLYLKRAGKAVAGTPLFLDGLRAYDDYAESLPLPATHLDFSSPWTAWWGAVKP